MNNQTQLRAFQLKGSLLTLTVLELLKPDIAAIQAQFISLIKQTPDLFRRMPMVIDLNKIVDNTIAIDFSQLLIMLRQQGLVPIGVRGGTPEQQEAAASAGFALLANTRAEKNDATPTTSAAEPATVNRSIAKLVVQPVRSGQQIYAKGGDLIVLNSVSAGAEVLADGNIHVYGILRGRALAGVTGDKNARIFCQKLDAELVSIAGHYWVNEDLTSIPDGQTVQIYLEDERLHIGTF